MNRNCIMLIMQCKQLIRVCLTWSVMLGSPLPPHHHGGLEGEDGLVGVVEFLKHW